MIAVDTNILVYAHRRDTRLNSKACAVVTTLAQGDQPWAVPWPCVYEFISVVTNRRIWGDEATTPTQAWRQVHAWATSPSNHMLGETEDFIGILHRFIDRPKIVGGVVHDARIAAICTAHGVEVLLTRDRDFSMFPEITTSDPLSA
ncbi:MAG: PIN domain-containing protein [Acidimicrobiaceae bacterium]|nr:PIN domain-containing protein [Acidimicrobiaceae bacterium]